jgi:hypothetical protein
MVSKVEKIKIEDESNGNVSPTINDTTDNTSTTATKDVDNSYEDDEQVYCFPPFPGLPPFAAFDTLFLKALSFGRFLTKGIVFIRCFNMSPPK